nr:MAG TPA: minor tail protein [Caudoviricetes sp.]
MAKNMFKFAMQLFAVDAASAKITAVQKKLSELNEASERIQQRGVDMMKNGSVKMLESVAMIAPLGKTILDASRVEDVMNELSNVAGMSAAKMADISDAFFQYSKKHNANQIEYLQTATAMAKSGLQGADGIAATNTAMTLAQATMSDAAGSAGLLANVYNALGDKTKPAAEEMNRLADILARTREVTKISNMEQLGQIMEKSIPTMVQYGLNIEQVGAAIGVMAKNGMNADEAGEGIKSLMENMTTAGAGLGFRIARDDRGNMNFAATLENIRARFGSINEMPPMLRERLRSAFGEGFKGLALLLDGSKEYEKMLEKMNNSIGTTARLEKQNSSAFSEKRKNMMSGFSALSAAIGKTFLPAATMAVDIVGRFLYALTDIYNNSTVIRWIVGLAGGVLTAVAAFTALSGAINIAGGASLFLVGQGGKMLSLMLKLAPAFIGATVHALSFSAALLANPVTWVIAGIVGLGVALVTVAKKWDFIKEKAQQFFNFILEKTSPILNIFKKIGGWFGFGKKAEAVQEINTKQESIVKNEAALRTAAPVEMPRPAEQEQQKTTVKPAVQNITNKPTVNITLNAGSVAEPEKVKGILDSFSDQVMKAIKEASTDKTRRAY